MPQEPTKKKAPAIKKESVATQAQVLPPVQQANLSQFYNALENQKFKLKDGKVQVGSFGRFVAPITTQLKSYQAVLAPALEAKRKADPNAKGLTEAEVDALLGAGGYKNLKTLEKGYADYRAKTPVNPRDTGKVEIVRTVDKATTYDPSAGGTYGDKVTDTVVNPELGDDFFNLFAPTKEDEFAPTNKQGFKIENKAAGGAVKKAPKMPKKKGYANGGQLTPEEQAQYDALTTDEERNEFFNNLKGPGTTGDGTDKSTKKLETSLSSSLPWLAAATAASDIGRSVLPKNEDGTAKSGVSETLDTQFTATHQQAIDEAKKGNYGMSAVSLLGGKNVMQIYNQLDKTSSIGKYNDKLLHGDQWEKNKQKKIANQIEATPLTRLKDGGTIKGPGTGKSDSIDADLDNRDFIIPVESADSEVVNNMMKQMGLNKKAPLKKGDVPVKVSNGEKIVPAERRDEAETILKSLGHKGGLAALAPNADKTDKFQDGTDEDGVPRATPKEEVYDFPGATDSTQSDKVLVKTEKGEPVKIVETIPSEKSTAKKSSPTIGSNIDWVSLIGPVQTVIGASSLLKDGKRPVDTLSPEYNNMIDQAKLAATYGFTPATGQQYKSDIEGARIANVGLAAQTAGGNPMVASANARLSTNQYAKQLLGYASEDERLKSQKQAYLNTLIADKQDKNRRLFEDKLNAFNVNQEAGAGLLNAGLQNIIGANRYKKEQDFYANLIKDDNTNSSSLGKSLIL